MKKILKSSILAVSGMALSFNFAVAEQRVHLEDYFDNLNVTIIENPVYYSASVRNAAGNPPFANQNELAEAPEAEYKPASGLTLTTLLQNEIKPLVKKMSAHIKGNAIANSTNVVDDTRAIGLQSGMQLRKNGTWSKRVVTNKDQGSSLNNISWYPDYRDTVGMRLTTGKFKMGSMPFTAVARLDVPLAKIKRSIEVDPNDANKSTTKVWFDARVDYSLPKNQRTSPLNKDKNYVQVLWFKAPIIEFYGYFIEDSTIDPSLKGEWKIKFVIDESELPQTGIPGIIHPKLDMKVYAEGHALQE